MGSTRDPITTQSRDVDLCVIGSNVHTCVRYDTCHWLLLYESSIEVNCRCSPSGPAVMSERHVTYADAVVHPGHQCMGYN